ncbi:MAG: NUDIX domain-containing protein [Bacteroidota bacterium]
MGFTYEYPRPAVTTDAVIFDLKGNKKEDLNILLIKRKNEPFKDSWALPGGFMDIEETLEECVAREVEEETGIKGMKFYQLEAFSSVDRDPRHRTISVAFWGFCHKTPQKKASSDAVDVKWFDLKSLPQLAFDHDLIVKKALKRALEVMAV